MKRQCICTICNEARFPETELEISVFDICHKNDPMPSDEWFIDQYQIILLKLELDKILKTNKDEFNNRSQ